jgi:hypothetical protein
MRGACGFEPRRRCVLSRWSRYRRVFGIALVAATVQFVFAGPRSGPPKSGSGKVDWIQFRDGHLVYGADEHGNRIPDFSTAGYGGGGVPIPEIAARAFVDPVPSGDDTQRIQAALDELAKQSPDSDGFRGALVLRKGIYRIAGTLLLNASGIVLRGDGPNDGGTLLVAQGAPHTLIRVGGSGSWQRTGAEHAIVDEYVPIGTNTITVDDAHEFHAGDRVIVEWQMSAAWIHAVGMDSIPARKDGRAIYQWKPGMALRFDRRILTVNGNHLVLDASLTNAIVPATERATVWRYSFPGRIEHAGVENLRSDGIAFEKSAGFANPESVTEGDHPTFVGGGYFDSNFAGYDAVENAWMRNVSVTHYTQIVEVHQFGRAITIDAIRGDHIETESTHAPPGAFKLDGQETLVEHCDVTGAYSHVWMTQARVAGPNVFRSCTAKGTHMDAGAHQRWATGTLYEDLKIQGAIRIENRGHMGTGHGWAGANSVLWNCETEGYLVENPPVAYNWAIGNKGANERGRGGEASGQIVSPGKHVEPLSLYDEQLRERLAGK